MQLKMTRRVGLAGMVVAGLVLAMAGSLQAQDFDLEIRVDKELYEPGEAVACTVGIVTRAAGVQGWSLGVKHDSTRQQAHCDQPANARHSCSATIDPHPYQSRRSFRWHH